MHGKYPILTYPQFYETVIFYPESLHGNFVMSAGFVLIVPVNVLTLNEILTAMITPPVHEKLNQELFLSDFSLNFWK